MIDWEKKLKEGEERLSNLRKVLNEKEEKTNENEIMLKQKEKDLYEVERKIESSNALLKEKEDDVNKRLAGLVSKEKVCLSCLVASICFPSKFNCNFAHFSCFVVGG